MNVPYYIILATAFFAFLYGTGRVLWPRTREHPYHFPVAIAVGMGIWIGVSFLLCVLGAYRPPVLVSLFWGTLLLAAIWILVRRQAVVARDLRPLDCLLLALMVVPALLLAVLPLLSFDANVYHLAVPNLYLRAGGFREIPYLVYSNWPLGMELLFGWGLALGDFVLAKLIHCGTGLLLVLTLYSYCRRRGHPMAGLLSAALFLLTEIVRIEMSWAYVDVAQAWLFFLAFAIWEEAVEEEGSLSLCAVLLGIIACLKLTGLACAMILGACHLASGRRNIKELVTLFGIPLLCWLPWALKSWIYTGNPVYPLLYGIFGGSYLNSELVQQLGAWHANIGMGRGFVDYLLLPYRIVFESGPEWNQFHGRLHPAWGVGIPLAVVGAVLDSRCRRLLLVAVLFGGYWALSSQQMRLLIPALPFLAVAAGLTIVKLWRRWLPVKNPNVLVAVGCLGAVWGIWSTVVEARSGLDASWSFRPSLAGGLRIERVICLGREPGTRGLPDYLGYVNRELPDDSRVLFLRSVGGLFCEREYIADSFFEVSQMAAMLKDPQWLQKERITHVVLARDQVAGSMVSLPEGFVSKLRRVFRGAHGDVYQVKD